MASTTTEEDVIVESSNSPQVSNPGTPRSDLTEARGTPPVRTNNIPVDMRNTPPPQAPQVRPQQPQSKYAQLLAVIEDMGKDIRPTYSSSKTSAERLKRGIVHARILVRECLMECERSARN